VKNVNLSGLTLDEKRKAGVTVALLNGTDRVNGWSLRHICQCYLNWRVTYVSFSNYDKGTAYGTGAEEKGTEVRNPHMEESGAYKGRRYYAQAHLSKGPGKYLYFPEMD
jgi:hypothetical protein